MDYTLKREMNIEPTAKAKTKVVMFTDGSGGEYIIHRKGYVTYENKNTGKKRQCYKFTSGGHTMVRLNCGLVVHLARAVISAFSKTEIKKWKRVRFKDHNPYNCNYDNLYMEDDEEDEKYENIEYSWQYIRNETE